MVFNDTYFFYRALNLQNVFKANLSQLRIILLITVKLQTYFGAHLVFLLMVQRSKYYAYASMMLENVIQTKYK